MVTLQEGPNKVAAVNKNTLRMYKDRLKNTVSIHPAAMSPTSRNHCDDNQTAAAEGPK